MSEIEADLDDLEAEDVDADASKDAAAMEVDGERMERLISQERRRRCVIRAGLCACAAVFAVSVFKLVVGTTCPGPRDTPWAVADPTSGSPALLKLPLHVHRFISEESAALGAASSAAQVREYVRSLNVIYRRQARVEFELQTSDTVDVRGADGRQFQDSVAQAQQLDVAGQSEAAANALTDLLHRVRAQQAQSLGSGPLSADGWHVYIAHHLPFCGMAPLGNAADRGVAFVRESGCARIAVRADAGVHPVAVIMAHELGHTMGLMHTEGDCGVMSMGAAGASLDASQIEQVRRVARTGRGWLPSGRVGQSGWRWRWRRRRLVPAPLPAAFTRVPRTPENWWCGTVRYVWGGEVAALSCRDPL